jgi:hypothetical protein
VGGQFEDLVKPTQIGTDGADCHNQEDRTGDPEADVFAVDRLEFCDESVFDLHGLGQTADDAYFQLTPGGDSPNIARISG